MSFYNWSVLMFHSRCLYSPSYSFPTSSPVARDQWRIFELIIKAGTKGVMGRGEKALFFFFPSLLARALRKVFNAAHGNKDNKLNKLLTEANKAPYLLRNHRHFALPKWKTDRFKNTFILSSCLKYN